MRWPCFWVIPCKLTMALPTRGKLQNFRASSDLTLANSLDLLGPGKQSLPDGLSTFKFLSGRVWSHSCPFLDGNRLRYDETRLADMFVDHGNPCIPQIFTNPSLAL